MIASKVGPLAYETKKASFSFTFPFLRKTKSATAATAVKKTAVKQSVVNKTLLKELKKCRLVLSRKHSLTPSSIYSDCQLSDMCVYEPSTAEQLHAIDGCEMENVFESDFLACIATAKRERSKENTKSNFKSPVKKKQKQSSMPVMRL